MKRDLIFIEHILDNIQAIEDFAVHSNRTAFKKNRMLQSAIIREIEVIGEAVKNISPSLKKQYPAIAWNEIARTRDKMIHHYFGVDLDIVWNIVELELQKLKKQMKKIRKEIK
ncbi:MAG: DUF86 domain-containing protein [Candidatus Woesearchaeota archaeon]